MTNSRVDLTEAASGRSAPRESSDLLVDGDPVPLEPGEPEGDAMEDPERDVRTGERHAQSRHPIDDQRTMEPKQERPAVEPDIDELELRLRVALHLPSARSEELPDRVGIVRPHVIEVLVEDAVEHRRGDDEEAAVAQAGEVAVHELEQCAVVEVLDDV